MQNNVSKLPKELSRIFTVIRKTLANKIDDFVKNFNLKQNLNSMMLMAIKEKNNSLTIGFVKKKCAPLIIIDLIIFDLRK